MRTWPTQRGKKSILSQTKSRFLLSFYFFSFAFSHHCFLSPSNSPLSQSTSAASWSQWKSLEHQALDTALANLWWCSLWGWSIKIIRCFPMVFILSPWPTLLPWLSCFLIHVLCYKTNPWKGRSSLSFPGFHGQFVCVYMWKPSSYSLTNKMTTNDDLAHRIWLK